VKTQIIQLEAHDDTISVRDKMDWSQTPRVLLIWPERGKVLRNRLDLILLERYCSSHGSQLALLTRDTEVIFQAGEAGIPVFQSRKTAQLQPWRKSFREFKRRELEDKVVEVRDRDLFLRGDKPVHKEFQPWSRISIFITAVIAVLAIAGMLFPSATITIEKEINQQSLIIPIRAIIGEDQVQISGQVPVQELEIVVEDLQSLPTSGTTAIPSEYAQGEVVFTNLGEEAITIPVNTILSTDSGNPVHFLTSEPGKVPEGGGESITIQITANNPGISGNVLADQITSISTSLEAEVAVSNPMPTSGGTDIFISAPNSSDQRRLSRNLSIRLKDLAAQEISELLTQEDILLTPDLENFETIEEIFTPEEGSPGDVLHLEKRGQFLVLYTSGDDLLSLAADLVKAQYQEENFEPLLESITISQLSSPVPGVTQSYTWRMEVSWNERKIMDQNEILQIVLGKKPIDAMNLLQKSLDLDVPPRINLSPSWWLRIPALPFRISISEGES
jgi:hypothetical protein